MIDRRNIIELIGKNRGKYHSCLLTCYSFDFSFFEERILPELRTANIKNVNVLADGHFLELAQENTTGKEFKHNKTYNFLPIYESGVFHPKIMLLTGVKHGLLIIGSGNITSSGLSTNDEIWGAFHLDSIENENAPLFAQVWLYLQHYTQQATGFINQQIEWLVKYSPWLNELPQIGSEISFKSIEQSIHFISNRSQFSIFEELVSIVPKKELMELTVISPYYDKKGAVLKQLFEHYHPSIFNCIVDVNSGLLPTDLDIAIENRISFYDWSACKEDYVKDYNRLHAKVIHFKFEGGSEYIFLGSANATAAAMGSIGSKGKNAEAGILIKRNSAPITSWIQELNIKIPKTKIQLANFSKTRGINVDAIPRAIFRQRIIYSELRGSEITIYLKTAEDLNLNISLMSRDGILLEVLEGTSKDKILNLKCKQPDEIFKIFVTDLSAIRISNFSIVHRVEYLMRCNPDPNQEKLDALFEEEYPDGEGVTTLLQYLDYNWADEDADKSIKSVSHSGFSSPKRLEVAKSDKIFEKLTADEFNKISNEMFLKQSGELSSPNLKIVEFLRLISSGSHSKNDEPSESQEQSLLEDKNQSGEGGEVQRKIIKKSDAKKEQIQISKYFSKLETLYISKLENFIESKALTLSPSEPITIRVFSNVLIAFELIQIFEGKKFIYQNNPMDESSTKEELYLPHGSVFSESNSIKKFLVNVFGKFLLLSTAGMKKYDYAVINENFNQKRRLLLIKALAVILKVSWKKEEDSYRDTLILNCLYFINPDKINDDLFWNELVEKMVLEKVSKEGIYFFTNNFMYSYKNWFSHWEEIALRKANLVRNTDELEVGNVIFSSKIGFTRISKKQDKNCHLLTLIREGFPLNKSSYILEEIEVGQKSIQYFERTYSEDNINTVV
ncbi:hypothetical protein FLAN108750_13850 [Flavobacterium antarcticum]|uniref:hypothetical protein n=1 Tax=Flavobacterium antarcticum TaxID=271155 RepID=UPI0003B7AE74|nr:hypothetical protein [Flavobacterium antarcticum]